MNVSVVVGSLRKASLNTLISLASPMLSSELSRSGNCLSTIKILTTIRPRNGPRSESASKLQTRSLPSKPMKNYYSGFVRFRVVFLRLKALDAGLWVLRLSCTSTDRRA